MKFDIALAFIATTYAMELGQEPVTVSQIKEYETAQFGDSAKDCIADRVYMYGESSPGELDGVKAACDDAVDSNKTFGWIA